MERLTCPVGGLLDPQMFGLEVWPQSFQLGEMDVNLILHCISTFEVLDPSLKISPWTTPMYFLGVSHLLRLGSLIYRSRGALHVHWEGLMHQQWGFRHVHPPGVHIQRSLCITLLSSVFALNIFKMKEEQGMRNAEADVSVMWFSVLLIQTGFKEEVSYLRLIIMSHLL